MAAVIDGAMTLSTVLSAAVLRVLNSTSETAAPATASDTFTLPFTGLNSAR